MLRVVSQNEAQLLPEVVLIEATSSLRGNCHIPSQLLTRGGADTSNAELSQAPPACPSGDSPPQGCTPQCQHPVPRPLSPLSSLLSSGEKSSMFTITQQFKEETLLALTQPPKAAWQWNPPVAAAACRARPSAPSVYLIALT